MEGHLGDTEYFQTAEYKSCQFGMSLYLRNNRKGLLIARYKVVKRDMVTATAATAALGSFFMGLFTNLPIAIA